MQLFYSILHRSATSNCYKMIQPNRFQNIFPPTQLQDIPHTKSTPCFGTEEKAMGGALQDALADSEPAC